MLKSQLLARLIVRHLQGAPLYNLFSATGTIVLTWLNLILTNFLDSIGEAVNANQRPESQYAIEKPYTFIFNLIYRDIGI